MIRTLTLFALLALSPFVVAKEAAPLYEDPATEARFKELAEELRCVKCQNQTLADSPAGIAEDLRREVHEMIEQGKSDDEIKEFLVSRYGDFIRYKPEFKASTFILWVGPFVLFVVGLTVLYFNLTRNRKVVIVETTPLSDAEKSRLTSLLDEQADTGDKRA